jgi:ribosomal protein S18 acetylase RimI-like enzyme
LDPEGASREILAELLRYNESQAGPQNAERFVLTVRGARGELLGGLAAMQYWNGMFIDYLWLDERIRGRGIGTELMQQAEESLRARGGEIIFLSTWSFQAPAFYEKLGFTAFGTLEGIPPGGSRTWYSKRLK